MTARIRLKGANDNRLPPLVWPVGSLWGIAATAAMVVLLSLPYLTPEDSAKLDELDRELVEMGARS